MLIFKQALLHQSRLAIKQGNDKWTYSQLLNSSQNIAVALLNKQQDLSEARVAFMVKPGFNYVATQWGIWQAGGVAVPLSLDYPLQSLQYAIEDTKSSIVVVSQEFKAKLNALCQERNLRLISIEEIVDQTLNQAAKLPEISPERMAMILYTSGTTNLPKGVVTTHANLIAQITTLVKAWAWSERDQILCVLPLHHVHGIVNVVSCSLYAGACCEFLPASFSPTLVFEIFKKEEVNVFMAVPTIYFKLIAFWEQASEEEQQKLSDVLAKFRLMVSGSAALPVSVMQKWFTISNHWLLERYGMTEIGMGISNPYNGERRPGCIGKPLPGVLVRLCNEEGVEVNSEPGEIQIKGANVFQQYWQRPQATEEAFTSDGWFRTGDIAEVVAGYYKILGRNSVDIIKSGGYKISALEIEEVLRTHPDISDCSVVGIESEEWGEIVAAAYTAPNELKPDSIGQWIMEKLPKYKSPKLYKWVEEFPRNSMGKVVKNELKKIF